MIKTERKTLKNSRIEHAYTLQGNKDYLFCLLYPFSPASLGMKETFSLSIPLRHNYHAQLFVSYLHPIRPEKL